MTTAQAQTASGPFAALARIPERFRRSISAGAYRPEIDGLRFFAIAIVVFGHFFQRGVRFFPPFRDVAEHTRLGWIFQIEPGLGVYLFFAISGFIIATQARKSRAAPLSGAFLKAYFGRRVLRIEPPYVILLLATWAFLSLTHYQPEATHQFFTEPQSLDLSLLGSVVYLHDLVWGTFPRLFPPGWTLEVEVQFYVTAPLLFALWFAVRSTGRRLALAAVVFIVATILPTLAPSEVGPAHLSYSILRYFNFFWLGMMLADAREWLALQCDRAPAFAMTALGWLGLVGFLCLTVFPETPLAGSLTRAAAAASVAAMFVSVFAAGSGFRRFCAAPWISLVGGACYSLYLVHMQILQTLSVAAMHRAPNLSFAGVLALMAGEVAVVVVAGLTFYVWVERPFMTPHWPSRLWARLRAGAAQGQAKTTAVAAE